MRVAARTTRLAPWRLTRLGPRLTAVLHGAIGIVVLLALWQAFAMLLASSPRLVAFTSMAPAPALKALANSASDGSLFIHLSASLGRVGGGLLIAAVGGIVFGVAIGVLAQLRSLTHVPFQLLRMVSPMAWMPVAVIAFETWNGAIVFIIAMAAIWPVLFSVSGAIRRLNPEWFELAVNLGANRWEVLRDFVMPAVAQDILAGLRLSLGVAWIVLVPAELLGVSSGLGYALNDSRDALEYDRLAAMVVAIGITGFALDGALHVLVRRWAWQDTG